MRDKSKVIVGVSFLLGGVYFLINILTKDMETFFVSGMVLCIVLGLAFLRNSKY